MTKLKMALAIANHQHRYPKYLGTEWFINRLEELMAWPKGKVWDLHVFMFGED